MDKLGSPLRRLTLLLALLCLVSIPGAYCLWQYAQGAAAPTDGSCSPMLGYFLFESTEVLPDDVPFEHHNNLILSIRDNAKGGLNSSKDTLEQTLKSDADGIVYGQQHVTGGNLELVTKDASNLNFVCHRVGDTIYCYTYSLSLVEGGTPDLTRIEVFLTVFTTVSESQWQILGSQPGSAVVLQISTDKDTFRSIDVSTWSPE